MSSGRTPIGAGGPAPGVGDEAADIAACTLLIVDDNEQNLELLQAYLEDLGCGVLVARDGQEALDQVEKRLPDLVLLDVMMPRMSGFQACARIKGNPATREIPVLMVTAESKRDQIVEADFRRKGVPATIYQFTVGAGQERTVKLVTVPEASSNYPAQVEITDQ